MNIWPFNISAKEQREASENQQIKAAREVEEDNILKDLKEFRDIGDKFNYLGREMVVYKHYEWVIHKFTYSDNIEYRKFGIWANYADKQGIIHSIEFSLGEGEVAGIAKENEE